MLATVGLIKRRPVGIQDGVRKWAQGERQVCSGERQAVGLGENTYPQDAKKIDPLVAYKTNAWI